MSSNIGSYKSQNRSFCITVNQIANNRQYAFHSLCSIWLLFFTEDNSCHPVTRTTIMCCHPYLGDHKQVVQLQGRVHFVNYFGLTNG